MVSAVKRERKIERERDRQWGHCRLHPENRGEILALNHTRLWVEGGNESAALPTAARRRRGEKINYESIGSDEVTPSD